MLTDWITGEPITPDDLRRELRTINSDLLRYASQPGEVLAVYCRHLAQRRAVLLRLLAEESES